MPLCPSPQPLLNSDAQHLRRNRRHRRYSLHLQHNRQQHDKMQSQSSSSSTTTTTTTRSQQRQMTSTPVNQPNGDFSGLNGLIRAALVEDSAIAVAAAAAAAASSPQFQLPSSSASSHMLPPPPPPPPPPAANQHQFQQIQAHQAVPIPASATSSTWPDYLPLGRGLGYMNINPNIDNHQRLQSSRESRIPMPCNRSQLCLYRVLEHANLLEYFETFIALGGDDVQQLVEAEEEEFLEIMSLVGMTQKPLHVRRLQKTLLKWRQDRRFFQLNGPLSSTHAHYHRYKHYSSPVKYILPFSQAPLEQELDSGQDSSMDQSRSSSSSYQQYLAPREVLIGAPKRPRLMDNLHRPNQNSEVPVPNSTDTEADESELEVEDVEQRRVGSKN